MGRFVDSAGLGARIASSAQTLGPVYIKFGQFVTSSPSIFGEELAHACRPLLGSTQPMNPAAVERILHESIGDRWRDEFADFDTTPIGSGAVAQVHRATLADGTVVAVKVSRIREQRTIEADLRVLSLVGRVLDWVVGRRLGIDVADAVYNFCAITPGETDLRVERERIEAWRDVVSDMDGVHVRVPYVVRRLSSQQVMVMEFIAAPRIDGIGECGEEYRLDVLRNLVISLMRVILETGHFHGDLHPANIFVSVHDGVPVLVDFGIAGQVDREVRSALKELLTSLSLFGDINGAAVALQRLGVISTSADLGQVVPRIARVISVTSGAFNEISLPELGAELRRLARDTNATIPRDVALMAKQVLYLEGYNRRLAPNWNPGQDKQFQRFVAGIGAEVLRGRPDVG